MQGSLDDLGFRGRGCFPSEKETRPPNAQKLIFIGKTEQLTPTFKPGKGGLGMCTLFPYVHSSESAWRCPPFAEPRQL